MSAYNVLAAQLSKPLREAADKLTAGIKSDLEKPPGKNRASREHAQYCWERGQRNLLLQRVMYALADLAAKSELFPPYSNFRNPAILKILLERNSYPDESYNEFMRKRLRKYGIREDNYGQVREQLLAWAGPLPPKPTLPVQAHSTRSTHKPAGSTPLLDYKPTEVVEQAPDGGEAPKAKRGKKKTAA